MRLIKNNHAVSEIVGAFVLLAMAVAVFSVIYINVLSDDGPSPVIYATVIGKLEGPENNPVVIFEHSGGEKIDADSKMWITIANSDVIETTVGDLLIDSYDIGYWNIGETLVYYSAIPLKDVTIEGKIGDLDSNSLTFLGTLQKGYEVPPGGKGGIWHFNESYWNETTGEVIDSSGNGNNGTALNGANTTDDVVNSLANRSGAFNFIDYDDYVEVPNAYSLCLTNNITIEAWFKPLSDKFGSTVGLLDSFGYTPYITNITGDNYLFAVVSEDSQHEGNLQTIDLTPHHQLSEESVVDVYYDFGEGNPNQNKMRPIIVNIYDNVYVVAYNTLSAGKNLSVYIKTFNISSDGFINYTGNFIFDDNESDIEEPNRPSIVKVSDFESYSIIAIVYSIKIDDSHPSVGIIRTINVSHDGKINYTGEIAYFDDVAGYGSSITHIDGDLFAIAYRDSSNLGVVKTFNIFSNGSIVYTGKELIFDNILCYEPNIINVTSNLIAIAYRGTSNDGILKTFNISSDGTIISTGNNKIFESLDCFNPFILHYSKNYYIVVYSTASQGSSEGYYIKLEIENNGSITLISNKNKVDLPQNNDRCNNPIAIKITKRGFGILFESIAGHNGHPGYLMPIEVEFPSDLYSRGIHKLGSYGMYANPNEVYVNINTITINASILAGSWNYVVLTYDRYDSSNQMKLYVNGLIANYTTLTEAIKITNSSLVFGDLFYGLIDEVGIYDKVLTDLEVYNNYKKFAPIIIFNVTSSQITYNSAKITWNTNINSTSIVRFGTTTPPSLPPISDTSNYVLSHSIILTSLQSKTTYYYEVQSTTQTGYTIIDNNGGMYYSFTTENRPPYEPSNPNPSDGKKNVKIDIVLEWVGGDPDGDIVRYDVYLNKSGTSQQKVSENQLVTFFDPNPDLEPNTKYYWQIIARDEAGATTVGPLWSFKTRNNL